MNSSGVGIEWHRMCFVFCCTVNLYITLLFHWWVDIQWLKMCSIFCSTVNLNLIELFNWRVGIEWNKMCSQHMNFFGSSLGIEWHKMCIVFCSTVNLYIIQLFNWGRHWVAQNVFTTNFKCFGSGQTIAATGLKSLITMRNYT